MKKKINMRCKKPEYVDLLPPCNKACPAGENIQQWLLLLQEGDFRGAWDVIMTDNPFPAIMGRACYHSCEDTCNRNYLDSAVSIHAAERFLGDTALAERWTVKCAPETNKKVLIVGAGPSGLAAAYHLRKMGHSVTVYDSKAVAGGMMHYAIPEYRLPKSVIAAEIKRISDMGVTITLEKEVADLLAEQKAGKFDAVFLAMGAQQGQAIDIDTNSKEHVLEAIAILREVVKKQEYAPFKNRNIAVYGGGNTAMDMARTAVRCGATSVKVIYRRDAEHMPAHENEYREALEEGIVFHFLRTIKKVRGREITTEMMKINEQGKPEPLGKFETLQADIIVLALGQTVNIDALKNMPEIKINPNSTIETDAHMMTGRDSVFAGGDMLPFDRNIATAVGHGKKAARNIDAYLNKDFYDKGAKHNGVTYDMMDMWLNEKTPQIKQVKLNPQKRLVSFEEISKGIDQKQAIYEAGRCLSCGNCFECDGCYSACPEDAVIKLGKGKRYRFDYDLCTGCEACFEQCPCAAIRMVPENQENNTHD